MGKILYEGLAGPDDPIYYSEPARSYPPHWARAYLQVEEDFANHLEWTPTPMTEPELFRRCREAL